MLPRPGAREIDRRRRMALPRQPNARQDPQERINNFEDVYLPYDEEAAITEAMRCIQCPSAPCRKACPLHNDIPLALWQIENGLFEDAAAVFHRTSTMAEVCGRLCPRGTQCEGACVYVKKGESAVAIGRLEAFVVDYLTARGGRETVVAAPTGRNAAVVGAGPAGLTVAQLLARRGHAVTVFEKRLAGGGTLRYGMPRFKLDHKVVDDHVEYTRQLGVEFAFNTKVGEDITVDDLFERGFGAVFLGVGAGIAADPQIPGEDLKGIDKATPFLIRANVDEDLRPEYPGEPPVVGERVVVIGGGYDALDCVRTAIRLGADDVTCVCCRSEKEMSDNAIDRALAREEGIKFEWLAQPTRFIADGKGRVVALECKRIEPSEADESGHHTALVEGSTFAMPADTVVLALGCRPDPLIGEKTHGLETHDGGFITVDEQTGATSRPGVFAGGNDVVGSVLVVTAVAHGRRAAEAMHEYLTRRR